MSFESKKIIEQDRIVQSSKLIVLSVVQLLGMFVLGVGLVFGGLKVYNVIKDYSANTQSTSVTTAQKKEEQLTSIVNGLMVGVGGKGHRGAYNTDTLTVVSYNPATKQLNLISLPRDLYIQVDGTYYGRINSVLEYYLSKKMTLSGALEQLSTKVGDLIGQNIHYYGLIDFKGFENMIDTLGGLKVTVPENLYD
ncbi:MAG: LCP family protein, partial [Candidatus Absconditabacterales bacterium]